MTVLPSIPDHWKIEKLAGVVDDELEVVVDPQVGHWCKAALFIDDVVTQDVEPRINALLHQDPVICRKIMLRVKIDSENGISRQSEKGGEIKCGPGLTGSSFGYSHSNDKRLRIIRSVSSHRLTGSLRSSIVFGLCRPRILLYLISHVG
jgi:hypothetical protein